MKKYILLAVHSSVIMLTLQASYADETVKLSPEEAMFFGVSEFVESATRFPKPMLQVAENVSVIRAAEIEQMNVHSLYNVLARLPGVFMDYYPQEINGLGFTNILGSRAEQVLVLIDGVRLNSSADGMAQLHAIHPSIVERIEVIKGPASSAWGSSLGGVVNIFTKKAEGNEPFYGSISGSWGVMETGDIHGEVAGNLGKFGYYLSAGRQDSDGIENRRFFRSNDLYAKLSLALPHDIKLTSTFGYAEPSFRPLNNPISGNDQNDEEELNFFTLGLDSRLSKNFSLYLGARYLNRELFIATYNAGISGYYHDTAIGEFIYADKWNEVSSGVNIHVSGRLGQHTLALGGELNRNKIEKSSLFGNWAQTNWGSPAIDFGTPGEDKTIGVYASDTIKLGDWAVTPGIRYDDHSLSGENISPSLGLTWLLSNDTLLRVQASKGFFQPILSFLAVSSIYNYTNPDLKPEKVMSWQAGVESTALPYLRAKATFFLHQVDAEWMRSSPVTNGGSVDRQGLELELETVSWNDFSAKANYTYYYITPDDARPHDSAQVANLMLRYDNFKQFQAELSGHYVWWDEFFTVSNGVGRGDYGSMLWDLNLSREFTSEDVGNRLKFFVIGHNLFDGRQCANIAYFNPGRWVEAGLKWTF